MKAIGFMKVGTADVLEYMNLPDPIAGADEVIIEMKAIGVNFADIYRRRGEYPAEPPLPFVLGHEGAGIVRSLGKGVTEFSVGDRVAFAHVPRAQAELVKAPAWKVIPLPPGISFATAASVLLQGLTAHYLAHESYPVVRGNTVLIHSASGGVGLLLTQICKILGAHIIGTVSTLEKANLAGLAGADHVVVRSEESWTNSVLALTHGLGVDAAFDAIGSTLHETLSLVRPGGTAVYYGWAGGAPAPLDPNLLMTDSKTLVGGELWSHIADRQSLLKRADALFSWVLQGELKTHIFGTYGLAQASEVHRLLESGSTSGKLLLVTDPVLPISRCVSENKDDGYCQIS